MTVGPTVMPMSLASTPNLHDADSAEHDRRSKPGQIADHPTTERDHDIVALDSALEHRTNDGTGGIPALAAFATWDGDRLDRQSGRFERSADALTMKRPDIRVGDDEGLPRLWPLCGYMPASLVHDPRAYKDPGLAAGRIQHHIRLSRFEDNRGDLLDDEGLGHGVGDQCQVRPVVGRLPRAFEICDALQRIGSRQQRTLDRLVAQRLLIADPLQYHLWRGVERYRQCPRSIEKIGRPDLFAEHRAAAGGDHGG